MFADDVKLICPTNEVNSLMEDLRKTFLWTSVWDMRLNVAKSQHLHLGPGPAPQLVMPDNTRELLPVPLAHKTTDLGVIVNSENKSTDQVTAAVKKARRMLAMLNRTFSKMSPEVFLPAYSALVRSQLEYCVQAWSPHLLGDVQKLERVQRAATRLVPGLRGLSYEDRLNRLNLFSLERRRVRGDLIQVFKMLNGSSRIPVDKFFKPRPAGNRRGHHLMFFKPQTRTSLRASSFEIRVINPWNALPSEIVSSPSLMIFKSRLDGAWASLDTRWFPR